MARNSIAPGGYIGGEPPRRPMFNQLSGVWKLDDAMERQRAGTWANPLGIEDLFSTYLYTGNGGVQTITNGIDLSGKGGLVWIKSRSAATGPNLQDTANGTGTFLSTWETSANRSLSDAVTSFNSNGFSLGSGVTYNRTNTNADTYASWTFRKAAKFFDVVTYVGNGGTQNIAHNLGSEPGFVIIKATSTSGNWVCYHRSLGTGNAVFLNLTNASTAASDISAVSSTTFSVSGSQPRSNESGQTYVAYLFAHDAGGFGDSGNDSVVSCGSYTGNGSTSGPTVTLGWEPQWLIVKRTDASASWFMFDNMRGVATGGNDAELYADGSFAESTAANRLAFSSTGFVLESSAAQVNASGGTFIYIAIRRGPMKTPTDATKVFDVDATRSAPPLSYNAGFPVDMFIQAAKLSNPQKAFGLSRLTGSQALTTNTTDAEVAASFTFDSSIGIPSGASASSDHVSWMFRRAPGFFDVVAYTGTGSARTVAHNLGVAPELMIIKSRSGGFGWAVYSSFLGPSSHVRLNLDLQALGTTMWNNTAPSPTVFSVLDASFTNASSYTYIAYLFASCPGVSKVGNYTGTGAAQTIDCGFTNGARFVMIKRTDSTGDWSVWDSARGIFFGTEPELRLNTTAAETTNTNNIEPASVGFAISNISTLNANGGSYLFLAIA